jgi:hypothetical protein
MATATAINSKVRVKMLTSIAGLGDANPADLAKKYARMERDLRSKTRKRDGITAQIYTEDQIAGLVNSEKRRDADEPRRGFAQEFQFKAGEEALIDSLIAEKWEAAGICVALPAEKTKAA